MIKNFTCLINIDMLYYLNNSLHIGSLNKLDKCILEFFKNFNTEIKLFN